MDSNQGPLLLELTNYATTGSNVYLFFAKLKIFKQKNTNRRSRPGSLYSNPQHSWLGSPIYHPEPRSFRLEFRPHRPALPARTTSSDLAWRNSWSCTAHPRSCQTVSGHLLPSFPACFFHTPAGHLRPAEINAIKLFDCDGNDSLITFPLSVEMKSFFDPDCLLRPCQTERIWINWAIWQSLQKKYVFNYRYVRMI